MLRYICSLPNPGTQGPVRELFYLDNDDGHALAEAFAKRENKPGRGVFDCMRDGAKSRCKDTVGALYKISVDLDLRNIVQSREEVIACLKGLLLPPKEIRDSGFGLHADWYFKEQVDDETGLAQAESIMKQLVKLLAGDPAPTHRAALLRRPGTDNTKEKGNPRKCHVLATSDTMYDVSEFEEMFDLYANRPLLTRKEEPKTNGHDTGFSTAAFKDPDGRLDVDALLAAMEPSGAGANNVEPPALLSLLQHGWHPTDAIERVVTGVMEVADRHGLGWDRDTEVREVTDRCISQVRKLCREYDHTTGIIPSWLVGEFHDAWAGVLVRGRRPELRRGPGGWYVRDEASNAAENSNDDAGAESRAEHETEDQRAFAIPLTVDEWLRRDLPPPDCLLAEWITTTSRILLSADTGIGKTNLAMAIAAHTAAAVPFLHWRAHRMARVLYIDGEMSRRLFRLRIEDAVRRLGSTPGGLFLLSREDVEDFQPLNTPVGQAFLNMYLEQIGGIDLVIFDNIMALIAGDQKDEDSWTRVLPLVNSLTKRSIGQIWINHTGHDATRSYGTKTREWRMDTVVHLTEVRRADTDVSFSLEFRKARERTPENRRNFEDVTIALIDDVWTCSVTTPRQVKPRPGSIDAKFLETLQEVLAGKEATTFQGQRAAKIDIWRNACTRCGLLDAEKPISSRTLFNRHKGRLIAANLVACHDNLVWVRP